jgi:imidazole glycerol-phosphate synthase subunit HisH
MLLIVDYGMGNVGAIRNMLVRLGVPNVVISGDPADCHKADKIILPGVGAFDVAVRNLEQQGLRDALVDAAGRRRIPVLGICLGMQLLGSGSEEGVLPGLSLIPGKVKRFDATLLGQRLRVPHMGWNDVAIARPHALLEGFDGGLRFYFVHSFHFVCDSADDSVGTTLYGYPITTVVARQNVAGVQFHPEKSHKFGMKLLSNFAVAS